MITKTICPESVTVIFHSFLGWLFLIPSGNGSKGYLEIDQMFREELFTIEMIKLMTAIVYSL